MTNRDRAYDRAYKLLGGVYGQEWAEKLSDDISTALDEAEERGGRSMLNRCCERLDGFFAGNGENLADVLRRVLGDKP